jgi:hypothetical protein
MVAMGVSESSQGVDGSEESFALLNLTKINAVKKKQYKSSEEWLTGHREISASSNVYPEYSGRLCKFCQGISIDSLARPGGYEHHSTLREFHSSTKSCRGCGIIQNEASAAIPLDRNEWGPLILFLDDARIRSPSTLTESTRFWPQFKVGVCIAGRHNSRDSVPEPPSTPCSSTDLDHLHLISTPSDAVSYISIFTDVGDPAAELDSHTRPTMPKNTASQESFYRARQWLRTCVEEHEPAPTRSSSSPVERPARLLEVRYEEGLECVRVVLTESEMPSFAALSYCWGPTSAVWKTNTQNYARRQSWFPVAQLAQTIQDACSITHELGLRHVWIDSICILQDDEVDWSREAAKMGSVYSLAQVSIAGASAADAQAGLFNSKSTDHISDHMSEGGHFMSKITSTLSDGRVSNLYLCSNRVFARSRQYEPLVESGPWAKRAWTYQEEILSSRILYYTDKQLFWQCAHCEECEDGPISPRHQRQLVDDWYWKWCNIVVPGYSGRKLRRSSDFLIAISALARAASAQKPDAYYAGMWRCGLLNCLCWRRFGPGRKSPTYRAPSWSWASQESRTEHVWGMDDEDIDCSLVSVSTELRDSDPYGRVSGGELQLEARGLPYLSNESISTIGDLGGSSDSDCLVVTRFDDDCETARSCTALFVDDASPWQSNTCRFLLLATNVDGTYRRIGMALGTPKRSHTTLTTNNSLNRYRRFCKEIQRIEKIVYRIV